MTDKTLGQIAFEAGEAGVWSFANHKRWERIALAVAEAVRTESAQAMRDMEERKDAAYLERNRVVAALAKCFPSGVARTAIEGWSDDWHGCVYIDLPTGQASWHFHDSHAFLFAGLPAYLASWDGHSTDEKYGRLAALPYAVHAQPNDWRLPHDLKAGHVTFRKGVHCSSLVTRMEYLYSEAFPGIADLTDEQRAENLAALQAACAGSPEVIDLIPRTQEEQRQWLEGAQCDLARPPAQQAGESLTADGREFGSFNELLGYVAFCTVRECGDTTTWETLSDWDRRKWERAASAVIDTARFNDKLAAISTPPARQALSDAARDVLAERERQVSVEGWTPEHDDLHSGGDLALAAACYARNSDNVRGYVIWPWASDWWKPSRDRRRNLIKAGALILAEIERLDRASGIGTQEGGK